MGNFRYIPDEQKRLVAIMSLRMSNTSMSSATGISTRAIRRLLRNWRTTGSVSRKSTKACRPQILNALEIDYLESLIERQPDIYLRELHQSLQMAYGTDVAESTIYRTLQRRGFSLKKITRPARERDEELRDRFQADIGEHYPPHTLVFLDEAACNRHTSTRLRGWAPIGHRARRHDFFVRGQRYSILPAISLDGVLHLDIMTRSWTADEFRTYIDILLDNMNPYPGRNSVLIMDNASAHHFDGLREMIEARGMRLRYLPPYSPDFDPVEEGFSAMKAWIRSNRDYVLTELSEEEGCDPYSILWRAVFETMTPDNIIGWYRDSGYVVHD